MYSLPQQGFFVSVLESTSLYFYELVLYNLFSYMNFILK